MSPLSTLRKPIRKPIRKTKPFLSEKVTEQICLGDFSDLIWDSGVPKASLTVIPRLEDIPLLGREVALSSLPIFPDPPPSWKPQRAFQFPTKLDDRAYWVRPPYLLIPDESPLSRAQNGDRLQFISPSRVWEGIVTTVWFHETSDDALDKHGVFRLLNVHRQSECDLSGYRRCLVIEYWKA